MYTLNKKMMYRIPSIPNALQLILNSTAAKSLKLFSFHNDTNQWSMEQACITILYCIAPLHLLMIETQLINQQQALQSQLQSTQFLTSEKQHLAFIF